MPYNSVNQLPSTIKKLPVEAQRMFLEVFNKSYDRNGEDVAYQVAWSMVKKHFKKSDKGWVARTEDFLIEEFYTFNTEMPDEVLIQRTEDGEEYFELPVASLEPHSDGFSNTIEVLEQLEEQFNSGEFIGDFDHEVFDALKSKYSIEQVIQLMKGKPGISKSIQAYINNNILYLKGKIDKRYSNLVRKSKGLSVEALMKMDKQNKKFVGAKLLGFSFGLKKTPADFGTRIAG